MNETQGQPFLYCVFSIHPLAICLILDKKYSRWDCPTKYIFIHFQGSKKSTKVLKLLERGRGHIPKNIII